MKKKTLIEWLVVIVLILVFAYTGWHRPLIIQLQRAMIYTGLFSPDISEPPAVTHLGIYKMSVKDEEGLVHALDEFVGQVIFINFWATWCPPCRAEMPGINKLYHQLNPPELQYIILTTEKDFAKAIAYKKEEGFDFPIYQLTGPLPSIYRDNSIPRSYVVSKNGEMIMKHTGLADYNSRQFREFLNSALK